MMCMKKTVTKRVRFLNISLLYFLGLGRASNMAQQLGLNPQLVSYALNQPIAPYALNQPIASHSLNQPPPQINPAAVASLCKFFYSILVNFSSMNM